MKRIVNGPTAASLGYGLAKETEQTILVFDLGGGTFDVSILELGEGVLEVKSSIGAGFCGRVGAAAVRLVGANVPSRILNSNVQATAVAR